MTDLLQVTTTTASAADARCIAAALVERRLAACVQVVGPMTSTYRWEGRIAVDEEWRLTAKTQTALFSAVESAIRELHEYDVPEIVATPIAAASSDYADWLRAETTDDDTPPKS